MARNPKPRLIDLTQDVVDEIVETAYQPPAQVDAFNPSLPVEAASARLRSYLERIERLKEEADALTADIAEVFAEAKNEGFVVAVMRDLIRIRAMEDAEDRLITLKLYHDRAGMKVWPT